MPVIDVSTEIKAPIERVFNLSRSIDLHVASTAHTGECPVAGVTTGLIGPGQEVTWRARHFGIWQHLTSRITAFDPPAHFRDSLVRGAFRRFDHDHFFSARGESTVMRDVFDYQSPFGALGRIADVASDGCIVNERQCTKRKSVGLLPSAIIAAHRPIKIKAF